MEEKSSEDAPLWKTTACKHGAKLNTQYYTLTSPTSSFSTVLGSSGKKVVFHHGQDLVFVAAFPNAMIKNNNTDNGVPSKKQWAEIPTSVLLEKKKKMAFMRPAALPSSGYSRRSCLTHSNSNYQILNKTKRKGKNTLGPCSELRM